MISTKYREGIVEVIDILNNTNEEEVEKIPKNFIEFLEENKSDTYVSNLDHSQSIKEMKLKPETEAILGLIYIKYWADEQGKKYFEEKIKKNEEIYQKELKNKYNEKKLFEQRKSIPKRELPIEVVHKSLWRRIIDKIKNIFKR